MKLGTDNILLVVTSLGDIYFAIINSRANTVRGKTMNF
jgi:hypothetical protein